MAAVLKGEEKTLYLASAEGHGAETGVPEGIQGLEQPVQRAVEKLSGLDELAGLHECRDRLLVVDRLGPGRRCEEEGHDGKRADSRQQKEPCRFHGWISLVCAPHGSARQIFSAPMAIGIPQFRRHRVALSALLGQVGHHEAVGPGPVHHEADDGEPARYRLPDAVRLHAADGGVAGPARSRPAVARAW